MTCLPHARTLLSLPIVLSLLFPGCAPRSHQPHTALPPSALVDRELHDASQAILHDLALLNGSTQRLAPSLQDGPLSSPMSLTYDGVLQGALEKICAATGMQLHVTGTAKTDVPCLVHVRARDTPARQILRDIGLQTGPEERIVVSEDMRSIELHFLSTAEAKGLHSQASRP